MKQCSKCKLPQSESSFSKCKSTSDGLYAWCKLCAKDYRRKDYEADPEKHKARNHKWRQNNSEYNKTRNKEWLEENVEHRKDYKKKYRKENRDQINTYKRKRLKKLQQDPKYRLEMNLRKRLYRTVKKIQGSPLENKSCTRENRKLLGCSIEFLQGLLESQFTQGMTWENYGEWHVDHIRPIASFDLTDEKQMQECFHHTNLQPLWAIDNIRKGNKITSDESNQNDL